MKRLKKHLKSGMKGNIQDYILIPVILFVLAVIAGPILTITTQYVPQLKSFMQANNAPQESINTLSIVENLNVTYDQIFIMIAVGMGLGAIISSFFIKTHPAFFFVSLLIFLVAMSITPLMANIFGSYIYHYPGVDYLQKLPITSFIMQNYGFYLLAMFIITGILLYGKFQSLGKERE